MQNWTEKEEKSHDFIWEYILFHCGHLLKYFEVNFQTSLSMHNFRQNKKRFQGIEWSWFFGIYMLTEPEKKYCRMTVHLQPWDRFTLSMDEDKDRV